MNWSKRMKPIPIDSGFKMEGYWIWCGSVIKGDDGKYHMFASRWSRKLPHHSWMFASEIVRAVSDNPIGPFKFEEIVLPQRGAKYWDGRCTHNPFIRKYKDKYILYYMGSTHPFEEVKPGEVVEKDDKRCIVGRANKRVGMAISNSVYGPWIRFDKPILDTRIHSFDSYRTSNPTACINDDGSVLLMYKARSYEGNSWSKMKIGVAYAKTFDSEYIRLSEKPVFDENVHIEDPYIWGGNGKYYMIAKDMEGNICGEKYGGVFATSLDGIKWNMEKGNLSYTRHVLWENGVTEQLFKMERPFILQENGVDKAMYFAVMRSSNDENDTTFNMAVPLIYM
jgi:hypothetical protein